MKTISPVNVWYNGSEVEATVLSASVQNDNLSNTATFQYQLLNVIGNIGYTYLQPVAQNFLTITGTDYQDWDASPSANEWAYNWIATQLKLTITGEYVPPTPVTPTTPTTPTETKTEE